MQKLAKALVVGEDKRLVLAHGSADGPAELVALERWGRCAVKKVARIESVVAHEFVKGTVHRVRTGLSHDGDLRSGTLAILGAVGIAQGVEFTYRIHP